MNDPFNPNQPIGRLEPRPPKSHDVEIPPPPTYETMPLPDPNAKPILQSKGVVGGLVAFLSALIVFLQEIGVETISVILTALGLEPELASTIVTILFLVIGALGGVLGTVGRVVARRPIDTSDWI